jgi:hypothetical protein
MDGFELYYGVWMAESGQLTLIWLVVGGYPEGMDGKVRVFAKGGPPGAASSCAYAAGAGPCGIGSTVQYRTDRLYCAVEVHTDKQYYSMKSN